MNFPTEAQIKAAHEASWKFVDENPRPAGLAECIAYNRLMLRAALIAADKAEWRPVEGIIFSEGQEVIGSFKKGKIIAACWHCGGKWFWQVEGEERECFPEKFRPLSLPPEEG